NPARTGQTIVAGFVLGLVLGLIVSLVLESMDTSAGSMEEVESSLDVPVIGSVQHLAHEEAAALFSDMEGLATSGDELERQMRLVTHFAPASAMAESYRGIRTNLLFSQLGEYRVIVITSATIWEGKSTVSANLATVVAQQGARVLLIDANMRDPMQHEMFGLEREPGLSEYLLGQRSWQDATRHISDVMLGNFGVDHALMTPGLDQLDILTCGRHVANPSDLLAIPAMAELLGQARQEYDMVIVDMPSLLHTTDANVVAGEVDGVLLVYHIGTVTRGALKRAKNSVDTVGGTVVGVVLNGVRGDVSSDFTKSKADRYYGHDEHAEGRASWLDWIKANALHVFRKNSDHARNWLRWRGHKGQS
ncbi:MAG: polysaccharide biosynthesis tyrosine autokinase, partial [Mariprofundaceae bacterium]|nr:polysaccharide biosynthesis tyrosine autokinase [Mariprofundaceae bacterium]